MGPTNPRQLCCKSWCPKQFEYNEPKISNKKVKSKHWIEDSMIIKDDVDIEILRGLLNKIKDGKIYFEIEEDN
ncbi:MAG: hypothetical protein CMF62_00605 [Magnetococcales bacterium]|nr:hypothetical protein [Magnetococcales bacterium]|tara:strand:- start:16093 stop:16311 length:219 start_codon:yes stop_codon:yes gene_type:complete